MSYVMKYDVLPSRTINNTLEPTQERIKQLEKLQKFFTKLEISILGEGFRNPIVISAKSKSDVALRYGGSRLMIAQKHNLDIPCIIVDFDNVFPNSKVLNNVAQVYKCFKDRPKKIIPKPYGLNISGCQHIHLKEDEMSWSYIVRYAVIPSTLIYNECGPDSAGPDGWTKHIMKKKEIASQKYIDSQNRKNGFYEKLEESILKEGVRNPILVTAGWCPESKIHCLPLEMHEDSTKILICHSNGGSRLWVCQQHNLDVPCIISDFVGMFSNEKILTTKEEILECYKDKPRSAKLGGHGAQITSLPQIHLEEEE